MIDDEDNNNQQPQIDWGDFLNQPVEDTKDVDRMHPPYYDYDFVLADGTVVREHGYLVITSTSYIVGRGLNQIYAAYPMTSLLRVTQVA